MDAEACGRQSLQHPRGSTAVWAGCGAGLGSGRTARVLCPDQGAASRRRRRVQAASRVEGPRTALGPLGLVPGKPRPEDARRGPNPRGSPWQRLICVATVGLFSCFCAEAFDGLAAGSMWKERENLLSNCHPDGRRRQTTRAISLVRGERRLGRQGAAPTDRPQLPGRGGSVREGRPAPSPNVRMKHSSWKMS